MSKEEKIIDLICKEYAISQDEFNSQYRYGKLPEARQLYCLVLKSLGYKTGKIAELTEFSPARVTISFQAAEKRCSEIWIFKKRHDTLVNKFIK